MPILSTSAVMDTEDFLHPELRSPKYSVPSPPLPNSMESQLFSTNSWPPFSQQPHYNQHYPMQQSGRQYQPNSASLGVFSDMDFSDLTSSRNGDFAPDLSCIDELSNTSLFSSTPDSLSEYADPASFDLSSLAHGTSQGSTSVPALWETPGHSQRELVPSVPHSHKFSGLNSLDEISAILSNTPIAGHKLPEVVQPPPEEVEEADVEETEELGHMDTYAEYKPSKSTIGISHPDIVVETSTLSSVPPPDVTYTLSIPDNAIQTGLLSALQLEAIIYACQQHEVILQNNQRAGFLIGDGAGVGKGRTVAGIILENYLKGRKRALWFSVSNDLKYDAERDLKDIEAPNIPVFALNKIKYGDTATSEGVLFATYSALIGESQAGGQHRTRLKQILDWCKPDFDGVIVFDECHKAKNATSTKMGKAVLDLQNKLPLARVVYASATGASEPKNMIYMSRLGIWGEGTPFKTFEDFLHAIEKRGVGAMEIVAMDMKVSGMYIARQLSFSGVSFRIEEITLDEEFKVVYNKAARLWAEALDLFTRAADVLGLVSRKSLWGQFWSSHQRFFKYLCIAAKVRRLVELAQAEMDQGKCIVIGLQSTGEARTREVLDENDGHLDRFVSAAERVFHSLVQKHFPLEKPKREKATGNKRKRKPRGRPPKFPKHCVEVGGVIKISDDSDSDFEDIDSDSNSSPESLQDNDDVIFVHHINGPTAKLEELRHGLLAKIAELGKELPLNTLDELIDRFGGPEKVAEMTGRKGRVVRRPDGRVQYESRAEQGLTIDHVNVKEKERFMGGEKLVAIISEAASSGISLQADKRVQNQRRRVHMTLELPWSADRAIQQFGRTHRSNQVTAPEYIFLISELAGERRFASIVAKRLESLGALTHGDRRATESRDLSKYNFENKYGTKALDKITKAILGHIENKVPAPKGYPGGEARFFTEMKKGMIDVGIFCKEPRFGLNTEKGNDCTITKFLNRILGLEVHQQNSLFQYFTDNFDYLIEKDKKEGKYDMGILDLAPGNDEIHEEKQEVFLTPGNPQEGQVILYKISVDRGMPWGEACRKAEMLTREHEGFYLSHKLRGSQPCVLLAEQGRGRNLVLYKPNIGRQAHPENLDNLQLRYRKVTADEAKDCWENQFVFSFKKCSHANWKGKCKQVEQGQECWLGMRLRQYHMLCGALLRVWKRVADVVSDITNSSILQIVRLKTKQNSKQVGIKIPENCVERIRSELSHMDAEVKRARQERQKLAHEKLLQEQRTRQFFLCLEQQKLPLLSCKHPPPYPGTHPGQAAPPKTQNVDEVLDLTLSPCPSPEPIANGANGSSALNGAVCINGGFGMQRRGGSGGLKIPETFHLEELISQEQQRERQAPLQGVMAHVQSRLSQAPHNFLALKQQLKNSPQTIHTLKQQHTALGVLQQSRAHAPSVFGSQDSSQAVARFNPQILRLQNNEGKPLAQHKPQVNTLTNHTLHSHQLQQRTDTMPRASHSLVPSPLQQGRHQHASIHTHNPSMRPHALERQVSVNEHASLSLKTCQQSSQPISSQPVLKSSTAPQDDFDFDFDSPVHASPLPYTFSSQAPQASSSSSQLFSCSSQSTLSLFSSALSDSVSSSLFAPSSERPHLQVNGHCSMDALDAREPLDLMTRGASADRRQSVIQYKPLDWDS
ncbi:protein strawberry notch homolog 2a isoform X1 [Pygocentrus nattereri]|uniref:protein strawberry notch homolog 2a isoform X1 n=1 Tax=Pygocentrus nattereri TaxID=42514 RepID=UPI000814AD22|nr:protein strawberry notch homolog 2a isoform X1 [Pygocentrus nattereri]